jgi:SNF2 family DNA or RNA helicase
VASQRAGRIDPNPHQIDAVVFALSRLPEGGCILADEVGLGKTIEAVTCPPFPAQGL